MSENGLDVPEEMQEADRLVREFVQKVSEHVDSVQVFVSRKRDGGHKGTWQMALGDGNWFARYGQVRQWIVREDYFEEQRE